jgi:hypothetical protein
VVFATLVLAVQERQPKATDLTEQRQAEGDLLLNPNPATLFKDVGLKGQAPLCPLSGFLRGPLRESSQASRVSS